MALLCLLWCGLHPPIHHSGEQMSLLTGSHAFPKPIIIARAGNTIGLLLDLVRVISTQAMQLNMEQQGISKEVELLFGGIGELEAGEEATGVQSLSVRFCFLLR